MALSVLVHPLTREVVSVPVYGVHDTGPIIIIAQVTSFGINSATKSDRQLYIGTMKLVLHGSVLHTL